MFQGSANSNADKPVMGRKLEPGNISNIFNSLLHLTSELKEKEWK